MIRALISGMALVSIIAFTWPVTVVLTLGGALAEPLLPLAVGLLADILYLGNGWPLYSLYGGVVSCGALFVRSRLRAGIM